VRLRRIEREHLDSGENDTMYTLARVAAVMIGYFWV